METLGALFSGVIDAATLSPPTDGGATARGFRYVVYGPDLSIPYAAATITTRRSVVAKRGQMIARFMRAMADASRVMHWDRKFAYKVLQKKLRINDRSVLETGYATEIKVMEPRLEIKAQAIQTIIEEAQKTNPRAAEIKPQDLVDRRYLAEMETSGFFNQIWSDKR